MGALPASPIASLRRDCSATDAFRPVHTRKRMTGATGLSAVVHTSIEPTHGKYLGLSRE